MKWSTSTDFDSVCRRAAGRRRYNAKRRAKAGERYKQVIDAMSSLDGRKRGAQAQLARALGVHPSTICRDVARWRQFLLKVIHQYRSSIERSENAADEEKQRR